MTRHLPPLNALRAFEAAARHGSFVLAAEELGVTPAAISHQVKGLEDGLGVTLFVRGHRSVSLTREGNALLPGLTDGFNRLAAAVAAVRPARGDGPVVIGCGAAFAALWLMPRLDAFLAACPDTPVRLATTPAPLASLEEDVDLAVDMLPAATAPAGLRAEPLFRETVFPVCAPRLRVGLRRASELVLQTLIVDTSTEGRPDRAGWLTWLKAAGMEGMKATEQRLPSAGQALEAARRGQGVALGRSSLVCDDLRNGSLVKPFDVVAAAPVGHCLLSIAGRSERADVTRVRDWLLGQAASFRAAWPDLVL